MPFGGYNLSVDKITIYRERIDLMNKNLLVLMEERMPEFSKGQKRIARYILDHYDKAAYMTASRLGSIVEVSESTVVRFAI